MPPPEPTKPTASAPTSAPITGPSAPAEEILEQLPTRNRRHVRRLILRETARILAYSAAILTGYALLPVGADGATSGLLVLLGGIVVIIAVIARQLLKILDAERPVLQGLRAVAIILPLFIVIFAYAYAWMSADDPANFSQSLNRLDAVYFVVTVLSTVGFGDITPVSSVARATVSMQMILDLILIVGVAKLIVGVTQISAQRRRSERASAPASEDDTSRQTSG